LSSLRETLETAMLAEPKYWEKYYQGDEQKRLFKRKYSFSDRLRYYWPLPELDLAKNRLFENLRNNRIPFSLLSQFLPVQFYQVNEGLISTDPQELVHSYIQIVSGIYARACGLSVKSK
jgi:D-tagatose-1,6-bisphosphate aldolase subunit GatZ/KbaZ